MPPELTLENLAFRVYRGAELAADGTARRAAFRRDTSDVSARTIAVRFPATESRQEARLAASELEGNAQARRYVASGSVHGEQEGETADTARARYDAADGLVRGDEPITLRGGGFVATGASFTLDPRDGTLRLTGGMRGVAGGGR